MLAEVAALPEALELDTQRFKQQMDLKKQLVQLTMNIQKMQQLASALVQSIIASIADLPPYVAEFLGVIIIHYYCCYFTVVSTIADARQSDLCNRT